MPFVYLPLSWRSVHSNFSPTETFGREGPGGSGGGRMRRRPRRLAASRPRARLCRGKPATTDGACPVSMTALCHPHGDKRWP